MELEQAGRAHLQIHCQVYYPIKEILNEKRGQKDAERKREDEAKARWNEEIEELVTKL